MKTVSVKKLSEIYKKFFPNIPSIEDVIQNKELLSYDYAIDYVFPEDKKLKKLSYRLVDKLVAEYGYTRLPDNGASRVCVVSQDKSHVLKLPKDLGGVLDNYREQLLYLDAYNLGVDKFAECMIHGQVLCMEFVMTDVDPDLIEENREWIIMLDCEQVGITSDQHRLVAYDYGDLFITRSSGTVYIHTFFDTVDDIVNGNSTYYYSFNIA